MYQVLDIMNEYFDEKNTSNKGLLAERKLPVKAQKNQWNYEKDPERLVAKFTFKGSDSYAFFITELASLEKQMSHHGDIVCSYPTVDITVRTHDLEMVTKTDITYTKKVLEIYHDTIVLEKKL